MGAKRDRRWSTFNPRSTPRMHYAPFTEPSLSKKNKKKRRKKKKRKRKRIYVNLEQTAKLSSLLRRRGGLRHCRPNNFHFTGRKYFVRPPFFSPSLSLSLSSSLPLRFENLKAVFPCRGSEGEEGFLSRIRRGGRGVFAGEREDFPVDNKVSGEKVARHGRRWASRNAALQLWAIPRRGEPRNELAILPTISRLAARRRSLPASFSHLGGGGPLLGLRIMFRRWKEGREERSGNKKPCTGEFLMLVTSIQLLRTISLELGFDERKDLG